MDVLRKAAFDIPGKPQIYCAKLGVYHNPTLYSSPHEGLKTLWLVRFTDQ